MYINNERMSMQETEADAKSGPFLYVLNDERLQVIVSWNKLQILLYRRLYCSHR